MNAYFLLIPLRQRTHAPAPTFEHVAEFPLQSRSLAVLRAECP
jgi:hypothetical protein